MLVLNPLERESQIARLTRVIEAASAIRCVATTAEQQQVRRPATPFRLEKKARDVVRANCPFEAVKEKQARRPRLSGKTVEFDEVAIGRIPSLETNRKRGARAKKLPPHRLCVAAPYPPRGLIGILASTIRCHDSRVAD